MAKDLKYGKVTIKGIPADEPVFILRAQDALALKTIARYRNFVEQLEGASARKPSFVDGIDQTSAEFEAWQAENKTKLPD